MRIRHLLVAAGLLMTGYIFAQDYSTGSRRAIRYFESAQQHFRHQQDAEAEEWLHKAVAVDDRFIEAWFMLAQIYLDRQDMELAADYYRKGLYVDPEQHPRGFLKLADLEFETGQYTAARKHLDHWKSYGFEDQRSRPLADRLERNLSFALEAVADPVSFNPEPLGEAVNTSSYEYWPSLSIDEQMIFFTVLGPPNPDLPPKRLDLQEDFYYARRERGAWVDRTWLGAPLNTNTNEGAQTVTADGRAIYFTACNRSDGHGRMCDIYFSRVQDDGTWSEPVNLGDAVNTSASEKHPSISPDGRVLYFASNRGGGAGGYDIWMSVKTGNNWGTPVNMGDSVNTPGDEQSPFMHPDQQSLYFSSDGWPGMGKGDIFLSRLKADGSRRTPVNLGYPVNTHNEEVGFIVNAAGNRAYYSSNRRDGTDTDIYTFEVPPAVRPDPVSYISGRVYDADNMRGIAARFQLIDLETGQLAVESSSAAGEGAYILSLPSGRRYAFNVSHPGYLFYSDHFMLQPDFDQLEPLKMDIPLDPIDRGKMVVLENIFFDTDSYSLKEASLVELEKVWEFLEMNPGVKVEIAGHTDSSGRPAYNLELSEKRAGQVTEYLTGRGIDKDRLTSRGYGDTRPVADNNTEEGRAKNRRTALKIIDLQD